mgnify:CR=1 FL=1
MLRMILFQVHDLNIWKGIRIYGEMERERLRQAEQLRTAWSSYLTVSPLSFIDSANCGFLYMDIFYAQVLLVKSYQISF